MGTELKRALAFTDLVESTHLKIVGDKYNSDLSAFPPLSAEDFWSMLQKYLLFDEPTSRCTRLKKFMARQLKYSVAREKDLNNAKQDKQDELFDAIYGGRPTPDSSRLLSVLLALEEIGCFEEIAFASWAIESGASEPSQGHSSQFRRGLETWFQDANLSPGQIHWLNHCFVATPDWSYLKGDGPWSGSMLAAFLLAALKQIDEKFIAEAKFDAKFFASVHAGFLRLLQVFRSDLPGGFMPRTIVIVEGPTEEVLLPRFAKVMGVDFQSQAFMIVSAGGAKQVAKRYLFLRDLVALPIVCILDRDAEEQASLISDAVRDCDRLFVLRSGEIEDTFDTATFARHLNKYLESFHGLVRPVAPDEITGRGSRKAVLNKLWKERKLGDFDKIAFAKSIADSLDTARDVPEEFVQIVKFLAEVAAENG
ncbi:MAG: hypothetical protein JST44_10340 [Cyanobacteria bacterium SZAS LIN-5]|nr:hypothetical protein [Cyanobacteria bacterium SZAS LIN-5]